MLTFLRRLIELHSKASVIDELEELMVSNKRQLIIDACLPSATYIPSKFKGQNTEVKHWMTAELARLWAGET